MKIKLLETFQLNRSGVFGMVWKQNDSYSTFTILCGRHMLYIIVNSLSCWHWSLVFLFLQLLIVNCCIYTYSAGKLSFT